MNSTDRYAFIALLFLVVVVAVAAFWDDGETAPVHAGDDDEGAGRRVARVDEPALPAPERRTRPRDEGRERGFALNGLDEDVNEQDRVTTRGEGDEGHSTEPLGGLEPVGRDDLADGAEAAPEAPPMRPLGGAPMRPVPGGNSEFLERNGARSLGVDGRDVRGADEPVAVEQPVERTANAAPQPAPVAGAGDLREYVVQPGDSLSVIASEQCGTHRMMHEIASLNGLADVDSITEGMTLKLPARAASAGPAPIPTTTSPEIKTARADGHPIVTIKPGQTLSELLYDRYGTYKSALPLVKALNPELDPDRVQAGQPIVLPHFDDVAGATRASDPTVASSAPSQPARRRSGNYVR